VNLQINSFGQKNRYQINQQQFSNKTIIPSEKDSFIKKNNSQLSFSGGKSKIISNLLEHINFKKIAGILKKEEPAILEKPFITGVGQHEKQSIIDDLVKRGADPATLPKATDTWTYGKKEEVLKTIKKQQDAKKLTQTQAADNSQKVGHSGNSDHTNADHVNHSDLQDIGDHHQSITEQANAFMDSSSGLSIDDIGNSFVNGVEPDHVNAFGEHIGTISEHAHEILTTVAENADSVAEHIHEIGIHLIKNLKDIF